MRIWGELPWWLTPARVRRERDLFAGQVDRMTGIEADLTAECARLRAKLRAALTAPRGNLNTATAAQQPEFVLIGIDRGNGLGKRLIAARDLPGAELAMTAIDDPPPRWVINATLARPLFIDRPDYAAALAHMQQVWANWDRDDQQARRNAIAANTSRNQPGHGVIEPPARGVIEP